MLAPSGHYRENFTRKLRYKKKITLSLHSLHGLPSLQSAVCSLQSAVCSLHGLHFNMTVRFSFAGGGGGGGGGCGYTQSSNPYIYQIFKFLSSCILCNIFLIDTKLENFPKPTVLFN